VERILKENAFNIPNLLTVLRITLLPAIVWRFRHGDSSGALALYIAAMLTDAADGFLARHLNLITAAGQLLDPIADKLSLLTILALFAAEGQISPWFLAAAMLKEGFLVLGSIVALRFDVVVSALPIGKLTTLSFVLSTVMRFLAMRKPADALLAVSFVLSLAALCWYSIQFFRKLQIQRAIA